MSNKTVTPDMVLENGANVMSKPYLTTRKIVLAILLLALFLFPILQFIVGGMNYWLHMILFTFMYMAMASSWNIIGGYAGYVSLGHNVFFAVGGYFSGLIFLYYGVSPFLTAPLAGLLAMAVGFLVGLITLRTSGAAFIISTIALALLTEISFDNWDFVGGANGLSLPLIPLSVEVTKLPFYYAMLFLVIGSVFVSYQIRHSKFGLGLRAISQDEIKAEVAGIPTSFYKILAFAISGLFVGMAGGLWGYYLTYLRPTLFLTIGISANIVLMCILGGKGTVAGPVLGAILLIAVNEFFVANLGFTQLNVVATGLIMLLTLIFFPKGVVGTLKERDKLPKLLDWE